MKRQRYMRWLWILVGLLLLMLSTACAVVDLAPQVTDEPEPVNQELDTAPATPEPVADIPDVDALRQLMLDLINENRADAGLAPVQMDALAQQVGDAHALELAEMVYMSHWNLMGYGPDIRYGLAGGTEYLRENLHSYWYRYDDGTAAPITDWEQRIIEAQAGLMASPGHRETILYPANTHVGIGIAYNPDKGELRIAQEFIIRHAECSVRELGSAVPETYEFTATLYDTASDPLINLAYEPFPEPLSMDQAEAVHTYESASENYDAFTPDGNDNRLVSTFTLPSDRQPGFYHVRLWVAVDGVEIPTCDVLLVVRD